MDVKKIILSLLLLAFMPTEVFSQQTYVVSVGISDYQNINDLRFTENDVALFNEVLDSQNVHIVSLVGSDATHMNVLKTLRDTFAKATSDDIVIFFFSGHGYEGGFCCYDMRPNSHMGGLSYQEMQIILRNCRAGSKLIFADACFSGGLSKQRTQLQVQAVSNNDVIFLLSSKLDETSLELPQGPSGLFTYFLVKGLAGYADMNTDGVISLNEIYKYVYTEVTDYADQIPHNQHPTLWKKGDVDLPVVRYK